MNIFDELRMPKVIYDVESELNGNIRVVDIGRTRKIVVDNIIQSLNPDSPACERLVWGQLAKQLKEKMPEAEKVLIFGMGGGTMASLISRNFPGIEITSVEHDPVMVDIAKKFFNVESIPNHKIITADALRVAIEPEAYDMIPSGFDVLVVDIFSGEKYPDLGKTGNFISASKRLVRGGGFVIFNRIYTEPNQEEVNIFMDNLEGYFSDVSYEVVAGYTNSDNIIIFGKV
jgi:spermidine synthase